MLLTSKSNLKLNKQKFEIVDELSFRVKNVYNSSLYEIYKHYDATGKYIGYNSLDLLMKNHPSNTSYRALNAQVSQQTIKKLDGSFKSFFALLKKKKKNQNDYDKPINKPHFLDKEKGRKEIILQNGSFRIKENKILVSIPKDLQEKHNIKFLELPFPCYLKDKKVKCIEIIPSPTGYSMSIVYEEQELEANNNMDSWLSVDLGLNNLLTCTSNKLVPFIINGRPIKSINQKYNKKIAKLKSIIKKGSSKQIRELYSKRGDKLNNETHKITDFIVRTVKESNITAVVIGNNKEWKTGINIGKRNNQNFVQIPFDKIIKQLQYKLFLLGIEVIVQEESYTSKTSFMDLEPIKKQQTYIGKRVKRGLFRTGSGKLINADVNGSLNIFRKAIKNLSKEVQDALLREPLDTGLVMNPSRINLYSNTSVLEVNRLIASLKTKTDILLNKFNII